MNKIDLTGKKFGRLLVIAEVLERRKGKIFWRCKCDCGQIKIIMGQDISRGATQSCGCKLRETSKARCTIHGMKGTKVHTAWVNMRARCYGNRWDSKHYKERGIEVCPQWRDSFSNFFEDMGHPPSDLMTIDRIDVNGNYEPSNCRWASRQQQTRNRRCTHYVEFRGEKIELYCLAEKFGIRGRALYQRIFQQRWDIEKAVTTPFRPMLKGTTKRKQLQVYKAKLKELQSEKD